MSNKTQDCEWEVRGPIRQERAPRACVRLSATCVILIGHGLSPGHPLWIGYHHLLKCFCLWNMLSYFWKQHALSTPKFSKKSSCLFHCLFSQIIKNS